MDTKLITDSDIAVLNAARSILNRITQDHYTPDFAGMSMHEAVCSGRVAEAAHLAADAVFDALNAAQAYGGRKMTDVQIFNTAHREPEPEPEPEDAEVTA